MNRTEDIVFKKKSSDTSISTMVNKIPLNCKLDTVKLVSLLVVRYQKEQKIITKKKLDLPPIKNPGEIISVGYKDIKRGLIRSAKDNFKNALIIDIASNTKFINFKISESSIHSCGANSDVMLTEAVNYLFDHITYIQNILDRMNSDGEKTKNTIEWIKDITKGNEFKVIEGTDIIVDNGNIQYYKKSTINFAPYLENLYIDESILNRKSVGRILNYLLEQGIDRLINESVLLIGKYKYNVGLSNIIKIIMDNLMKVLKELRNENLVDNITLYKSKIDNADNYLSYINYIIDTYQFTVEYGPKSKDNTLIYNYNNTINTHYDDEDEELIKYFSLLINLCRDFKGKSIYLNVELSNGLIFPENIEELSKEKGNVDYEIAKYFMYLINDYKHHDIFSRQLDWIKTIDRIFTPDKNGGLSFEYIKYISINFNYNLGENISIRKLKNEINKLDGFNAERDQNSQKYVTIHIPYTIPDHLKKYIHKKNDKYVHTLLIYSKGAVTQSGPYYEMNCIAYDMFIKAFKKIKNNVICAVKNNNNTKINNWNNNNFDFNSIVLKSI